MNSLLMKTNVSEHDWGGLPCVYYNIYIFILYPRT